MIHDSFAEQQPSNVNIVNQPTSDRLYTIAVLRPYVWAVFLAHVPSAGS